MRYQSNSFAHHMLVEIRGSTASMGAEQQTSEGKTQSLGMALGSWLISDIWKAAGATR